MSNLYKTNNKCFLIRAVEQIFSFSERWNVPCNSASPSWMEHFIFHLMKQICTIALINIHYLYTRWIVRAAVTRCSCVLLLLNWRAYTASRVQRLYARVIYAAWRTPRDDFDFLDCHIFFQEGGFILNDSDKRTKWYCGQMNHADKMQK